MAWERRLHGFMIDRHVRKRTACDWPLIYDEHILVLVGISCGGVVHEVETKIPPKHQHSYNSTRCCQIWQ